MRFNVELNLENETIPKDKNRMILSYIKHILQSYDEEYYKSVYENEQNKMKNFTFALFMPNCKFERETIIIPNKKMFLNFSTSDMKMGISFYNAIIKNIRKKYEIKGNIIEATNINMNLEKNITDDYAVYKMMSPLVVREHEGDNKKTWYYSIKEEKGRNLFIENLRYQLLDEFGESRLLDIEGVRVEFNEEKIKTVKVKNYGIEVLSSLGIIKIYGKSYILDYLYKAGIGAKRSSGFGMVDLA